MSDGEMEKENVLLESECLVDKSNVKQTQLHIVKARPVSQVSANDKDKDREKDEDNDKNINKTATKMATTSKTRTTTKTNTVLKISRT